jgi:hypothetical protein
VNLPGLVGLRAARVRSSSVYEDSRLSLLYTLLHTEVIWMISFRCQLFSNAKFGKRDLIGLPCEKSPNVGLALILHNEVTYI